MAVATELAPAVVVELVRQAGAVVVAVVGLLGIVGVPVWRRLGKIKAAAEATRHQTQNDHDTNLRDDVDACIRMAHANTQAIGAVAVELKRLSQKLEGRTRRRWWR